MPNYELHLISDGKKSLRRFIEIAATVHPFLSYVHLREKTKTAKEIWEGVEALKNSGVPSEKIIVNDRVDVALAAGLGGTQLAYHSLEPKWVKRAFPRLRVGRSTHSLEEAEEMERQGADYVLFGHIFPSGSKPGLKARGIEALRAVTNKVKIPVIAIGGISPSNAPSVLRAGASGVAVMSGILDSADPVAAAERYFEALRRETTRAGR